MTKTYLNEQQLKNKNNKSACVNIFSELLLTDKFRHYLGMKTTSYY